MPQRLLPDLAFSPDHMVGIVLDRDADGRNSSRKG
jgi:hypothetical protein